MTVNLGDRSSRSGGKANTIRVFIRIDSDTTELFQQKLIRKRKTEVESNGIPHGRRRKIHLNYYISFLNNFLGTTCTFERIAKQSRLVD